MFDIQFARKIRWETLVEAITAIRENVGQFGRQMGAKGAAISKPMRDYNRGFYAGMNHAIKVLSEVRERGIPDPPAETSVQSLQSLLDSPPAP